MDRGSAEDMVTPQQEEADGTAGEAPARSRRLSRSGASSRTSPVNPRATIARYTSSESPCALPKSAPADAATNRPPVPQIPVGADGARTAGGVHVLDRDEQVEQVPVRHRQHEDHRRRQPQRSQPVQQRVHGVVTVRSTTREIDDRDPHDDEPRRLQALGGQSDRAAEPVAQGDDDRARRDQVQRGGEHDDPGEDGTKSHTRATKNPIERRLATRARGRDVHRCQRGDRVQERGDDAGDRAA